ncbi:rod shape-determining protein MreD [Patulibacter brassicae]|uniref:Rod shape-determining protein MreD n=1 Tax=Patulibacter brassicae TaxID=1705717 RepID=A0ABU4VGD0_9ACTN|nr:rod shape-determining protein MreD [Patulibacter brassicae]MDX8150848.1 rod shape-determining protein MreD [Patulibacter brassicae]
MSPRPTVTRSRRSPRRRFGRVGGVRVLDHAVLGPAAPLRVGLLGLLAGLLQLVLFSRITILGMQPDVAILTLLMVSLLCGPIWGASLGFGLGLLLDLVAGQPVGVTSLALVLSGYAVGRMGEVRDPESSAVPVVVGALGTFGVLAVVGLLELLIAQGARVNVGLLGWTLGTVLINALVALPVHNRIRRWLLPMLPEEARRRRRRRDYGRRSPSSDVDVRIR